MKDLLVVGDRNPNFVTHRELDAALELLPASVRALGWHRHAGRRTNRWRGRHLDRIRQPVS